MAKQKTAQKPQRQYLNVKHTTAPDGTVTPYRIDTEDGEEYPVAVLRSREISPGRARYTVEIEKRQMYLYRDGDQWWVE